MREISIVMPAYNAENYVAESIESVLAQSYTDYEFLILDDCSTDHTLQIIDQYAAKDNRIVVIKNKQNLGVAETRNRGFQAARGKWIALIDSDDVWVRDKLKKKMGFIQNHPNAFLTYTASQFMDMQGNRYSYVMHADKQIDYHTLLRKNLISCSSVIVDRSLMISVGMANDDISEDHAAWLKILKKISYAYGLDEPLLVYRISKTSRSGARLRAAYRQYGCYRYIGKNALSAMALTVLYTFYSVRKRRNIRKSLLESTN